MISPRVTSSPAIRTVAWATLAENSISARAARGVPSVEDIGIHYLEGDGDFRSPECIELLKQADIVVTNPPFSLFREYVAQLIEYDKKFVILGNKNALTYKEIFPLIKDNRLWIGVTSMSKDLLFDVPVDYARELRQTKKEGSAYRIVDGVVYGRLGSACWYTNLDYRQRHEELILFKRYSPEEYPHYDNYDAIEVSKVAHIPKDWDGAMGVPITFLDSHNPKQFEILGITDRQNNSGLKTKKYSSSDTPRYSELNRRSVIKTGDTYTLTYVRILIKNRNRYSA